MILVGDGVHNLTDGIVIGAAFVISVPLGISVGLAVAAHEVPQELADFGILLDGGFRPKKALWANLVSATPTIPGAALGYLAGDAFQGILWIFMVISAASFLYIGLADLVPKIHGRPTGAPLGRMGLLLLGGGLIAAIHYGFS